MEHSTQPAGQGVTPCRCRCSWKDGVKHALRPPYSDQEALSTQYAREINHLFIYFQQMIFASVLIMAIWISVLFKSWAFLCGVRGEGRMWVWLQVYAGMLRGYSPVLAHGVRGDVIIFPPSRLHILFWNRDLLNLKLAASVRLTGR